MNAFAALLLAATLTTIPPTPLIENGKAGQHLNFDLLIENTSDRKLEIQSIEASVLAANGALIVQRRVDTNGDSVATIPNRFVEPGGRLVVFNPIHTFEPDVELAHLRYVIAFDDESTATIDVRPRPYVNRTNLLLPVRGRILVHDGHDFHSHHRRLDITGDMTTALGIRTNFLRYAYDFVIVDEQGRMYRGDGERNEDWYGFGSPILAPGDGTVVFAENAIEDNTKSHRIRPPLEQVMKDVRILLGNAVILDHGNGEVSVLAHLKKGSVAVRAGERVRRGQKLGEMGMSGDAFLVHLHYQLQSDTKFGEGLPSYFAGFRRFTGSKWVRVKNGAVDSGDVIRVP